MLAEGSVDLVKFVGADMLTTKIELWLKTQGLIKPSQSCHFTMRLCGNWSALCFVDKKLRFFIKLQNFSSIAEEFQTLQFMHQALPEQVLAPIQMGKLDQKQIYVQQAQAHHALTSDVWIYEPTARQQVLHILTTLARFQLKQLAPIDERLIYSYKAYIPKHYAAQLKKLMLPSVLQHGDLSLNNLGVGKGVIIFDWEDYGLSQFPLMDLTVFLMSLCHFDQANWQWLQDQPFFEKWLTKALVPFSLSPSQFYFCMPYALMVFGSLKQQLGYSRDIIQWVDKMVKSLAKSLDGVVCA